MLKHFLEVLVTLPVTELWEPRFVTLAPLLGSHCGLEQILTFFFQGAFHMTTLLCVHVCICKWLCIVTNVIHK